MSKIQWRAQMKIGAPMIDLDHRRMVQYINELDDELHNGKPDIKKVGAMLLKLINYTKDHFKREEHLMMLCLYPDLDAHRAEHEKLARKVVDLGARYMKEPSLEVGEEAYQLAAAWLVDHIIHEDRKIAAYVGAEDQLAGMG